MPERSECVSALNRHSLVAQRISAEIRLFSQSFFPKPGRPLLRTLLSGSTLTLRTTRSLLMDQICMTFECITSIRRRGTRDTNVTFDPLGGPREYGNAIVARVRIMLEHRDKAPFRFAGTEAVRSLDLMESARHKPHRHPRESGDPVPRGLSGLLDPRFRGDDVWGRFHLNRARHCA